MKYLAAVLALFFSICIHAQEICDNGIDDDGDGLIDLNDRDCRCGNQTPVPSIIPNASFESYTECPNSISQLNNCTGWVQATTPTTDYYNTCGIVADAIRQFSASLMPFPDGNAIVGAIFSPQWNEYLGSCLSAPMLKDTTYQITYNIASLPADGGIGPCNRGVIDYDPVYITIYGTQNCVNLPLRTIFSPNIGSNTWVELGKAAYVPQTRWGQITITFTPTTDIAAIMIGPPPTLPPSYSNSNCYPYFLFDNLTLNKASNFDVNINPAGNYCDGNLVLSASLSVTVSGNAVYQWYKEGIAIAGATQATYSVIPGPDSLEQYTVRVTDGAECFLSPSYTINSLSPEPNITVVQPNCISDGTITVNTPAASYSFDNGVTWSASNISGPLVSGVYAVKTKSAAGCISMASIANLSYFSSLDYIDYTYVNPECGIPGSITITTQAHEYSFDGGDTWQTDNTKTLDYGTYNIQVKDTTGCVTGENYVYLQQPYLDSPLFSSEDVTCGSGGTITITTPADYYSIDGGATWVTGNTFSSLAVGYYYISIKDAIGCESGQVFVYIGYEDVYPPVADTRVMYCQGTVSQALTASGTDILWYDTATGGSPLSTAPIPDTSVLGEVWYYASQTIRNCESARTAIKVTVLETPLAPTATQYYEYCNNAATTTLTATGTGLVWYTMPDGGSGSTTAITPPSDVPGTFYYYVCQSLNGCEGPRIPITVVIHPIPPMPKTETTIAYKQYNPTEPLTATGENLIWYDSHLDPLAEKPVITSDVLGRTEYFVSQTINDCTSNLRKITIAVVPNYITIEYPRYFTPNGDGNHETWNIYTPKFGIKATVYIFDRYGKLIAQQQAPGWGWDGTFNGTPLPSTDYWFTVYYTEYGVAKTFGSHFSLIR